MFNDLVPTGFVLVGQKIVIIIFLCKPQTHCLSPRNGVFNPRDLYYQG